MAIRIHELHPTLVHFPLALFPVALLADIAGRLTGHRGLMKLGSRLMPVAAASGGVAAATGLVAQEAVRTRGASHDVLVTHRNLNLALVVATGVLAAARRKRDRPSLGYLAAGIGGLLVLNYTAYLGGKLVYQHGVGVEPADGVREDASPEMRRGSLRQAAGAAGKHAVHGLKHAAHHLKEGQLAPALRRP